MPRYFFILQWPDRVYDDIGGTVLPNDDAAYVHAQHIIGELKAGGGYDEEGTMMVVRDHTGKTVHTIPF